jgi:hypothetical protein
VGADTFKSRHFTVVGRGGIPSEPGGWMSDAGDGGGELGPVPGVPPTETWLTGD